MKKLLMISTGTLALALLLGEVLYPDFPLTLMASDGIGYAVLRAGIVITLTALLFREVIGFSVYRPLLIAAASGLSALATALLLSDSLSPADGVIFAETVIIFGLEILEGPVRSIPAVTRRPIGKLGVGNDFVKIS